MNDDNLFEQYLHALRQDPHADPPVGLSADLAAFARTLAKQAAAPTTAARRRMWERALLQSRITSNGYHKEMDSMNLMNTRPAPEKRKNTRPSWTLLAAGFAAVCIAIAAVLPKGMPPIFSGAPIAQQVSVTPAQFSIEATATAIIVGATQTAEGFFGAMATPSPITFEVITGTPMMNFAATADPNVIPLQPTFVPNTVTAPNAIYVYAPVIFEMSVMDQVLANYPNTSIQNVSLVYQVTLSDGTVVYVNAQPVINGTPQPALLVSQLFPYAQVLEVYTASYNGRELRSLRLDNGVVVVTNPVDGTIVYIIYEASVYSPLGNFTATPVPSVIPTHTATATQTWTPTPVP